MYSLTLVHSQLLSRAIEGADLVRRDTNSAEGPRGGYVPSIPITAIFTVLYFALGIGLTARLIKYHTSTKFMIAMIIGAFAYGIGLAMRFVTRTNDSLGLYIAQFALISLSPCATIASLYAMLSRFAVSLDAHKQLLLPTRWITLIFVMSDVLTFLIQSTGGTMSIPKGDKPDRDRAKLGQHLFQAGLILQGVSFAIFTLVFLVFLVRVVRVRAMWTRDAGYGAFADWRYVAAGLLVSCIAVIVRSVYRILEALEQGGDNGLARSEGAFFGLDGFPIWLSMAVFVPFWPGKVLTPCAPRYDLEGTGSGNKYVESPAMTMQEPRQSNVLRT